MAHLRTICLALASIFTLTLCKEESSDTVKFLFNPIMGTVTMVQEEKLPNTATYLNYTANIANPIVNAYTTDVQFGTNIQNTTGYDFVVDTTVKQIMAVAFQSDNLNWNQTYNITQSSTVQNLTTIYNKAIFGGRSAMGLDVTDTLCTLANMFCVSDAEFFAITSGSGPDGTDLQFPNIFGLAPNDKYAHQSAPDYVQKLKEKLQIKETSATLFLNTGSTLDEWCNPCSLISFGTDKVDNDIYMSGSWYSHPWEFTSDLDEREATIMLSAAKLGSSVFTNDKKRAMVATTRLNLLTFGKAHKDGYDSYAAMITEKYAPGTVNCAIAAGTNAGQCSLPGACSLYTLEPIVIELDDTEYTIPAQAYAQDIIIDATTGQTECQLGVAYDETATNDIALIGLAFMEQFVTMIDYENNRVRFAKNVNASASVKIDGPSDDDKDGLTTGQKFLIAMLVLGFIALALVLGVYICRCMSKSRARQDASAIAYQSVDH